MYWSTIGRRLLAAAFLSLTLHSLTAQTAPTTQTATATQAAIKVFAKALKDASAVARDAGTNLTEPENAALAVTLSDLATVFEVEATAARTDQYAGVGLPLALSRLKAVRNAATQPAFQGALDQLIATWPTSITDTHFSSATAQLRQVIAAMDELVRQKGHCCGGDLRTIVGFEQAGAANSNSNQTYFLNFFYSAPVPYWFSRPSRTLSDSMGPKLRWFGEVRVTSSPQQVSTSLAEFVPAFGQLFGQLKPVELAQSAEFLGGLGWRVASFRSFFRNGDDTHSRIGVYALVTAGATGRLGDPPKPQIFAVPSKDDAQAKLFNALFNQTLDQSTGKLVDLPKSAQIPYSDPATAPNHVGFIEKDSSRYTSQYFGGFRFLDQYIESAASRAASRLDLLIGQNQAVTGGMWRGLVVRLEGFVPIPLGSSNKMTDVIYVYGNVQLATSKSQDAQRLDVIRSQYGADKVFLKPGVDIAPSDPKLYIRNTDHLNRDFYRIGAGIDFFRLVKNYRETVGTTVAKLETIKGDGQTAIAGHKFEKGLRILALDADGKPVLNAPVKWTVTPAANTAGCTFVNGETTYSNTTGVSGLIEVACRPNSITGDYKVVAESNKQLLEFMLHNIALESLDPSPDPPTKSVASSGKVTGLAVTATQASKPVKDLNVVFTLSGENGADAHFAENSLSQTVTTGDQGVATAPEITAGAPGRVLLEAAAGGKKVTFTITVTN